MNQHRNTENPELQAMFLLICCHMVISWYWNIWLYGCTYWLQYTLFEILDATLFYTAYKGVHTYRTTQWSEYCTFLYCMHCMFLQTTVMLDMYHINISTIRVISRLPYTNMSWLPYREVEGGVVCSGVTPELPRKRLLFEKREKTSVCTIGPKYRDFYALRVGIEMLIFELDWYYIKKNWTTFQHW